MCSLFIHFFEKFKSILDRYYNNNDVTLVKNRRKLAILNNSTTRIYVGHIIEMIKEMIEEPS